MPRLTPVSTAQHATDQPQHLTQASFWRRSGAPGRSTQASFWGRQALIGRLCELSSLDAGVAITVAMGLVLDAQLAGETTAWITTTHSTFYPPDAARRGIDLQALVVIRAEQAQMLGRAADHLARSGAFGLLVIDLSSCADRHITLAMPLQSRLLGLAQKHQMALAVLSHKHDDEPSLSSLVSLRGQVQRHPLRDGRYRYETRFIKDKQRAPGWSHREDVDGSPGLR